MCVLGRCPGVGRSGEVQENAGVRGGDRQSSCSWNDDDADAGTGVQVPACSASDFALVYGARPLPSRHLSGFGWSDDTEALQYYGQIEGTAIQ